MQDVFIDGRIAVKPMPVYQGRRATVKYKGLLAQSGAQKVYMHVGYGQDWKDSTDIPMSYVGGQCWQTDITIEERAVELLLSITEAIGTTIGNESGR